MKKLISMILILLIAAALLAGCAANTPGEANARPTATPDNNAAASFIPDAITTLSPAMETIDPGSMMDKKGVRYWDSVRVGGGTDEKTWYKVYTDYDALIKDVPAAAELTEHYSREALKKVFVIAVFTTVRTGGYSFSLNKVDFKDEAADIYIGESAPSANTIVTQAFETHCVLIAVDSSRYSEQLTCSIIFGEPVKSKNPRN